MSATELSYRALAEAEKRYRGGRRDPDVVDREVDAYMVGYLAGHAARRTEVQEARAEVERLNAWINAHAYDSKGFKL